MPGRQADSWRANNRRMHHLLDCWPRTFCQPLSSHLTEIPDAVLPVRRARFRRTCSSMVRSLVVPHFAAISALLLFLTVSPVASHAQEFLLDPGQTTQSSNNTPMSTTASSTHVTPAPTDLEVSWRKMPARFLQDEKDMWLLPTKVAEGKNWLPTAIVIGGTAAFIKSDSPLERKVRQADIFSEYTTLPPGTFERDATGEDSAEQDATGSVPQPQMQMQAWDHEGLVMRSVKRTLEDQKELYRA